MRRSVRAILISSVIATLVPALAAQTEAHVPESPTRDAVSQPASSTSDSSTQAQPLTVTFSAGKLMISAQNCSLQQVLDAVRLQTGAVIEGPAFDSSRVTVQLGPDDPMKVIAGLLYASRFNYIIAAGPFTHKPEKIVLSARNSVPMNRPEPPPVIAQSAPAPPVEKPTDDASAIEEKLAAAVEGDDKAEKKDGAEDKEAKKEDK